MKTLTFMVLAAFLTPSAYAAYKTLPLSSGGGSGTVTSVSVSSANGFAGSVANSTSTPAITLSTSVNGIVKGNGSAFSAATAGTDYSAGTSALSTGILKSTNSTGGLSIAVAGDFPTLNQSTSGNAATATALAADPADCASGQYAVGITASGVATCATTPPTALQAQYFGTGSLGDSTCSGAVTLSDDAYYNNLTISSGCALQTKNFRVFVAGTLDITAAPAGSIVPSTAATGTAGTAGGGAGAGGTGVGSATVGGSSSGSAGGAGTTGVGAQGASPSGQVGCNGGAGGSGGAGGLSGSSAAGGVLRAGGACTTPVQMRGFVRDFLRGISLVVPSGVGAGGGSGGGDGSVSGGGGGGGASSPGTLWISANKINRGGSTATCAIHSNGNTGGAGGTPASGTAAGGGGGGGGGGGIVYVAYGSLTGSGSTSSICASGGAGGNGGSGSSTGAGGDGGGSGASGRVTLINLGAGTSSETVGSGGSAGGAHSGASGGTGATANNNQVNL